MEACEVSYLAAVTNYALRDHHLRMASQAVLPVFRVVPNKLVVLDKTF